MDLLKQQYVFTVTNLRKEVNDEDLDNPIYGTTTK